MTKLDTTTGPLASRRLTARTWFKGLVAAAVIGVGLGVWFNAACSWTPVSTVALEVSSPDGTLLAKLQRTTDGVLGGDTQLILDSKVAKASAQVLLGSYSLDVVPSWRDSSTLLITFRWPDQQHAFAGRDLVDRECKVGSRTVRIVFEPDSPTTFRRR